VVARHFPTTHLRNEQPVSSVRTHAGLCTETFPCGARRGAVLGYPSRARFIRARGSDELILAKRRQLKRFIPALSEAMTAMITLGFAGTLEQRSRPRRFG